MSVVLKTPLVIANDADLVRVSRENPGYRFEREADGAVVVSPTNTRGGAKSAEACGQLRDYKKRVGGNAFDSNTGFAIGPASRVYSPDASWVSQLRIDAIDPALREGFWPISPDVVIEVTSKSDRFSETVEKIQAFVDRGTVYAVAIDPATREVVEIGVAPPDLALDFDAIIDA